MDSFTVCVYCGSRAGRLPAYANAAREVGRLIAERGWGMVYGGGKAGLMGLVADAALAGGAEVVGVIPRSLMEREVGHRGLGKLHVVDTLHQRKQMMAERADAFITLPGGIGSMEELFEVWSWRQLGYHDQPIGLLDVEGYYEPLIGLIARMVDQGFVSQACSAMLQTGHDPAELLARLAAQARGSSRRDDYART